MWVGRRLALEEPLERPPCGPCTSLVCYGLLAKGLAVSEASSKTAPPDVVVGRSRGFLLDAWHYICYSMLFRARRFFFTATWRPSTLSESSREVSANHGRVAEATANTMTSQRGSTPPRPHFRGVWPTSHEVLPCWSDGLQGDNDIRGQVP